ncbi:unnamed protein product, partial [Larinioides sclopetarius]
SGDEAVGLESRPDDAAVGTESQQGAGSGTESQQGGGSGTESQPVCNFMNSKFPYVVNGPSRQDSQDSSTGDYSSGHSQETAVVGDFTSEVSLESGVVGDVSNSPNSQESPANDAEDMSAPVAGAIPSGRLPTQDEREQAIDDLMRGYVDVFRYCACVCDYLRPCSRWIQNSKIFKYFFRTSLGIITLLAFCFGVSNLFDCPASKELPILMMLLGIALPATVFTSWDPRNSLCPNAPRSCSRIGALIARLAFLMLFAGVLHFTYTISPSFDPVDHNYYCSIQFYYFAYYVNFIIIAIIILAFFVYAPTMIERFVDYERL